jgi:hypothetical protein
MTTINASDVAAAVLAAALDGKPRAGRLNAERIQSEYFPAASRSTVLRAINAANDAGDIVDLSHHGARPDWAPSRPYLLRTIANLQGARA